MLYRGIQSSVQDDILYAVAVVVSVAVEVDIAVVAAVERLAHRIATQLERFVVQPAYFDYDTLEAVLQDYRGTIQNHSLRF